MRTVLKWIGIILILILILFGVAAIALASNGSSKMNRSYDIEPEAVAISSDPATLERGRYLVSFGCIGCHGSNLGGKVLADDPMLGTIPAPNLTAGTGGVGATYSDVDFVRAIRHGVDSGGKPLVIMPANSFWYFSDEDLGAVISYLRSLSPVNNDPGERRIGPVAKVLVGAGLMKVIAAETIDHSGSRPQQPAISASGAYGEYLANISDCRTCHGPDLSGGPSPEPGAPAGPNLTPGGNLASWSADEFISTIRSGITSDGRELDPEYMPWQEYARMSNDDLAALFLYLQSLPVSP